MASRSIRVLVVDDSPLIREIIKDFITEAPGMEVAGTANDGKHALEVFDDLRPDIVTLDIQMPRMNGLETLDALLKRHPVPVIMVSSLTQRGADVTLDALERGAMDYVTKPEGVQGVAEGLRDHLLRTIRAMAGTDVERVLHARKERERRRQERRAGGGDKIGRTADQGPEIELEDKCIAIGISTGGPPALTSLFESIRSPLPPIVVVQHMPPQFTKPFANRLDSLSCLSVKEAATGDVLGPNKVFIAPGGKQLSLQKFGKSVKLLVRDGEPVSGHKPSADVMMTSAAEIYGQRCLGVIMTGMGRDGSDGCGKIRAGGGYVLGQDDESSDVYGMNKVAFVEGHVDRQFSLDDAAETIIGQVKRIWGPAAVASR